MANGTGYATRRATSTLGGLARMPTWQVPMVLGGFLAALAGVLTYAFNVAAQGATAAATAGVIYTIIFGAIGLLAYATSKTHVQNGSLMGAIAGIALVAIVGGTTGLFAGLLLLAGAIWGLASAR